MGIGAADFSSPTELRLDNQISTNISIAFSQFNWTISTGMTITTMMMMMISFKQFISFCGPSFVSEEQSLSVTDNNK